MKITHNQIRRLIRETLISERLACPAGQVYYNYGGNVEGCMDKKTAGGDTGQKDPHEQKFYSDCIVQIRKDGRKPTSAAIQQCIAKKTKQSSKKESRIRSIVNEIMNPTWSLD